MAITIVDKKPSPLMNGGYQDVVELRGLSTDTKPTKGIGVGSTYLATDTIKVYIFDGSAWHQA